MPDAQTEAKQRTVAKQMRLDIGIAILVSMYQNDDLPLPNVHRLSKTMQEYFVSEGHIDDVKERGYKWSPDADYWRNHLSDIRAEMRKAKRWYFEFVREQGELKGEWKFVSKEEYLASLARDHADISTRVDTHNDKIQDGQQRWKVELPLIADVPLLPSN